jgi:transcription elongation GreA/GreB family factor
VLREGDAWYRIFQSRWRKAASTHRVLERQKSKSPSSERLAQLEALYRHRKAERDWHANPSARLVAGPHFDGERTPVSELIALANWTAQTVEALEAAEVPRIAFDPITAGRHRVAQIGSYSGRVEAARRTLGEFEALSTSWLAAALPRVRTHLEFSSWTTRIRALQDVIAQVEGATYLLSKMAHVGIQTDAALRAITTSCELPQRVKELEADGNAKALLGHHFQGRNTKVETALVAHAYGTLVKKARLPAKIEQMLISVAAVNNHAQLNKFIRDISDGWNDVADFERSMARYGKFEPRQWASADDKADSDYAAVLATRTLRAVSDTAVLLPWAQYVAARDNVSKLGLGPYVIVMESGAVPAEKLHDAFAYRFYASIAQVAFERSRVLKQFSGRTHASVRADYARLDREIIKLRGRQVAYDCKNASNPPSGNYSVRVDEKTEMELLKHLEPQARPRVAVRNLLMRAGRAVQEMKPCFMMGPQAVAQFLKPGVLHFDIIVMDEASQLKPEEAIGAIARGAQLVVVGDPKQLPPTSFFSRMNGPDADEDGLGPMASDAESILDVCISHFQPVRTLRWHYRSRHESLIAFSSHHFYRGNLVVFPSPYPKSKALGLRYQYVPDGVYENQMNQVEARRVVDAVVEHVIHRPDDCLGVVTLNVKQRDLLAEMLEDRLRAVPEATAFKERWEAQGMDLFVKNLENVQGDERDCIIISTTFGKPPGVVSVRQNFGPISREGGWRRLNVLFTRARKSVVVFSSMRPEDIVEEPKTPEGTRALRNYLDYARGGILPMNRETGKEPDSEFEVAVMDVLRGHGFEVTPQLGVAGFRIDIAVKHPDHRSGYLAAIECDGASYHTGVSVRDRDRIRQEILESLGWHGRIWRIWSTDWFRSPLAETERLLDFLRAQRSQPLPAEYVVDQEPDSGDAHDAAEAQAPTEEEAGHQTSELVFEDADDDFEVRVGDLVSYAPTDAPDQEMRVRISARQTNLHMGLVAENTPLGAVLMGATVGEAVVLRVPGKQPQTFTILRVNRESEVAAA